MMKSTTVADDEFPPYTKMSSQDDNPYRSPEEAEASQRPSKPRAILCAPAVVVLCCLALHAWVLVRWVFFREDTDWLDVNGLDPSLMIMGVLAGLPCSIGTVYHRGATNRMIGAIGLLTCFACCIVIALFVVLWS